MSGTTNNFGLTYLDPGDSFSVNGYAFTKSNIETIDSLVALGRDHEHTGAAGGVTDPITAPTLVLDTTQGNIPAGTTVRYKYTYVDQFGNETAPSPEATVATAAPVDAPGGVAASYATTGGTLLGGTYYYAISAYVTTSTAETRVSTIKASISIPFSSSTNSVTLTLPSLPAGATGFNIYRRAPGEGNYNYLDSVNMAVATPPTEYVDTGGTSPNCDRHPATSNNTNSLNNITITLPGATPAVPAGVTWRIYRTYTAGNYNGSVLKHVVSNDPFYLDLGAGTTSGSPPAASRIIAQPDKITLTDLEEVDGTLPVGANIVPYHITFVHGGTLDSVVTGTVIWRNPFDKAQIQSVSCTLGIGFSPVSTDVIVDVNRYDSQAATPSWATVYTTQGNRPVVSVGEFIGTPTVPDVVDLVEGDLLSIDIDQIGGGATPNDEDLTVTIYMYVQSGSTTTSVVI